jgi:methyl-accepting chemotaxis protein/methyl-accepting chemotaxis protein-1 (serine sensor receptor)
MSLTGKLLGAFAALSGLLVLLAGACLWIARSLEGDLERAANVTARRQYLAGAGDTTASEMVSLERGSVLAAVLGDKTRADQLQLDFRGKAEVLRKALLELHALGGSDESGSLLQTLDRQAAGVGPAQQELAGALSNQQMDAALAMFSQKVQPALEEIGQQASALVEQQARDLAAASQASADKASRSRWASIGLGMLALLVGAFVFRMVQQANVALRQLSRRMAESAGQVAGAAGQVSAASQSLAQGATHQAASLEETSASTEQIASISRKNADHSHQVADWMEQSQAGAGEVNQTLDRMVEKMKEIDASSQKIAKIIKINFGFWRLLCRP